MSTKKESVEDIRRIIQHRDQAGNLYGVEIEGAKEGDNISAHSFGDDLVISVNGVELGRIPIKELESGPVIDFSWQ